MATELDPRASLAEFVADYPPGVAADVLAFAQQLPDARVRDFLTILLAVTRVASDDTLDGEAQIWEGVCAHFAGIAPALRLVKRHVEGSLDGCQDEPGADCPFEVGAAA
jgi:hypothetical protein